MKINQKTVVPFIYLTFILIGIDMVTTIIGIKLRLEESNFISLMFINLFGNFLGLIVSMTVKCIVVVFPMIAYHYVEKGLDTSFLKNIYMLLYMALIVIAILTTIYVDIKNIMAIVNELQRQELQRSSSLLG